MSLQRRMQYPFDSLVRAKEFHHLIGNGHVAVHPDAERLDPLQQLKGGNGRETSAEVAQPFCARAHDEGGLPELLVEDDTVISAVGFGQSRELSPCPPIETPAVHNHPTDGDAMAADPLSDRIHHDVGAKLDRTAQ